MRETELDNVENEYTIRTVKNGFVLLKNSMHQFNNDVLVFTSAIDLGHFLTNNLKEPWSGKTNHDEAGNNIIITDIGPVEVSSLKPYINQEGLVGKTVIEPVSSNLERAAQIMEDGFDLKPRNGVWPRCKNCRTKLDTVDKNKGETFCDNCRVQE